MSTLSLSPAATYADTARAMNAIRSVVRALRTDTRALETHLGISLAQLFVLEQLAQSPVESLNELADRTATHQSSVSVVVRRLTERGLVARTAAPGDKRRIHIALTEAGRRVLAEAPPTIQAKLVSGLTRMADGRRHELAELIEGWLEEAGIDQNAPPMLGEEDRRHEALSA